MLIVFIVQVHALHNEPGGDGGLFIILQAAAARMHKPVGRMCATTTVCCGAGELRVQGTTL